MVGTETLLDPHLIAKSVGANVALLAEAIPLVGGPRSWPVLARTRRAVGVLQADLAVLLVALGLALETVAREADAAVDANV